MKTIICSVMDGYFVKEYELTYEEDEMAKFFEELKQTNILEVKSNDDMARVHNLVWSAEKFDKINILQTEEDVKSYIEELHQAPMLDLTTLYILMKSNGKMRNQQVREIFRNFLDLYTYSEKNCYDTYYLSQIVRKMYEMGAADEVPRYDAEMVRVNTEALNDIGFSIEAKIQRQKEQENNTKKLSIR